MKCTRFSWFVSGAILLTSSCCLGDDNLFKDVKVRIEGLVAFTEGPAWHPDGNVYFSDGANNRILRRDRKGQIHVYRQPSGRANGLLFDLKGRLVCCEGAGEGGNRRVTRTELDGTITVLTDRFKGKRYNSPNDLAIDRKGRIYFTDPRYGPRDGMEILDSNDKAIEGVYRIGLDGRVDQILSHEVDRPNGILVTPDGKYLVIADNNNNVAGAKRVIWRFQLDQAGDVVPKSRKALYDFGTNRGGDGMALDSAGRVYIAAGLHVANPPLETNDAKGGIYVITLDGQYKGFIPILEDSVTNCTFGGPELKTLFITAGHKLWSVQLKTSGYLAWPRPR